GNTLILVFEEFLANPSKGPVLGRARLIRTAHIGLPRSWPWEEAKQRLERFTVLIHVDLAIQEIIRIINLEPPSGFGPWRYVALGGCSPPSDQEILITTKLGSSPNCVNSCQGVLPQGFRVAMGNDCANAKIVIYVVRDAAREEICSLHDIGRQDEISHDLRG